jgi:hypothetical protein
VPDLPPSPMVVELSDETMKKLADLMRYAIEQYTPVAPSSVEIDRLTSTAAGQMKDAVLAALDEHDQPT